MGSVTSQLFNKQLKITHNMTNIVTGLETSSPMRVITIYIDNVTIDVVNSEIREVHLDLRSSELLIQSLGTGKTSRKRR